MLTLGTNRTYLSPKFRTPTPAASPLVVSGNSGIDRIFFYDGVDIFLEATTGISDPPIEVSCIPGSSWSYRWDNDTTAKTQMALYDVLHSTNGSGWANAGGVYANEFAIALTWAQHAWENGRGGLGAETVWWATWARQDGDVGADYQQRFKAWPELMDYCNAQMPFGQKPTRIIPGSWIWHRIWEDQANALTPTATFYDDLFAVGDPFHQSDVGEYLNTIVNLSCLYGIDPLTFPTSIPSRTPPTETERLYMCAVIKSIVSNFPRAGVDTSGWG